MTHGVRLPTACCMLPPPTPPSAPPVCAPRRPRPLQYPAAAPCQAACTTSWLCPGALWSPAVHTSQRGYTGLWGGHASDTVLVCKDRPTGMCLWLWLGSEQSHKRSCPCAVHHCKTARACDRFCKALCRCWPWLCLPPLADCCCRGGLCKHAHARCVSSCRGRTLHRVLPTHSLEHCATAKTLQACRHDTHMLLLLLHATPPARHGQACMQGGISPGLAPHHNHHTGPRLPLVPCWWIRCVPDRVSTTDPVWTAAWVWVKCAQYEFSTVLLVLLLACQHSSSPHRHLVHGHKLKRVTELLESLAGNTVLLSVYCGDGGVCVQRCKGALWGTVRAARNASKGACVSQFALGGQGAQPGDSFSNSAAVQDP